MSSIVLNIITEFTNEFLTMIDGNTNDLSLNELSRSAHISFMFHELFSNGIKSIHPVPHSRHSLSQFLRPQVSSITSVSADKIPLLHLKCCMGTFKGILSGSAHVVVMTPHYSRATGPFCSTTLGWLYLLFPRSKKSPFRHFDDQFVQQRRTTLETCINKMANHPVFTAGDADHSSDRSSIIKWRWQMNGRLNGIHWPIHCWSLLR